MEKFKVCIKEKYQKRYFSTFEQQLVQREGNKLVKLQVVETNKKRGFTGQCQQDDECNPREQAKPLGDSKIKRTPIEPADLFKSKDERKPVRKVLLEGHAGIGKSTFCTKLSQDWADGILLQEFELVLLLPLREDLISKAQSLSELLRLYHCDKVLCQSIESELMKNEGKGVLIVADGWDEIQETARKKGFLYDLITGQILPFVSILLTSRPTASAQLHKNKLIDRCVEVVGFSKENIKDYIESEFEADHEKASCLLEQLDDNPLIASICSVPLSCAIVCFLWQAFNGELPRTMTGLYTKIILNIILRNIEKIPEYSNIDTLANFDSLPEALQGPWSNLCQFAYQAIELGKLGISQKGLPALDNTLLCFGLLQSTLSVRYDECFHFLHLTLQEYLAAYHLSKQSLEKQLEVCQFHADSDHFEMVWRFFFGISCNKSLNNGSVKLNPLVVSAFVRLAGDEHLLLCHCSFEANNCYDVTSQIALLLDGMFLYPRTAHDCAAIVSVVDNACSSESTRIDFSDCGIRDKGLESLTATLASKSEKIQITNLNLSGNHISGESLSQLFQKSKLSLQSLTSVDLSENALVASGIRVLVDAICANTLSEIMTLNLSKTLTKDADYNAALLPDLVKALLTHCTNLRKLDLSENCLGVPGAQYLGKALSEVPPNKRGLELHLNKTMLGDEGVFAFAQNACCLKELHLAGNSIQYSGMFYLADCIDSRRFITLTNLDLGNNPLGLHSVACIGRMLSSNYCLLEDLSLSNCCLTTPCDNPFSTDSSVTSITDVPQVLCQMPENYSLKYLTLDKNNLSEQNILLLFALMYLCRGLHYLYTRECGIVQNDLELLLSQLFNYCIKLNDFSSWSLDENNLTDNAVDSLVECLYLFPNLEDVTFHRNPEISEGVEKKLKEEIFMQRMLLSLGLRVVRGPDWQSGDADGGEGHVGTVVEIGEPNNGGRRTVVQWDCGNRGSYCCGVDGKFELRVLDSVATGISHSEDCSICGVDGISGIRWTHNEYHLCTSCYMAGSTTNEHSNTLRAEFVCNDDDDRSSDEEEQGGLRVQVPARAGCRRVEAKGLFPGAEVVRGPDWDHGEEDGGDGKTGMVVLLDHSYDYDNKKKYLAAEVQWICTDKTTTCRIGHRGKVDIKYITAASGGHYYPEHLPILGAPYDFQRKQAEAMQIVPDDENQCSLNDHDVRRKFESNIIKAGSFAQCSIDSEGYVTADEADDSEDSRPSVTFHHLKYVKISRNMYADHKSNRTDGSMPAIDEQVDMTPILKDLLRELQSTIADRWEDIGIQLDLEEGTLNTVRVDHPGDAKSCLRAILKTWLRRVDPPPSWCAIIEAIEVVGDEQLASYLRHKYTTL